MCISVNLLVKSPGDPKLDGENDSGYHGGILVSSVNEFLRSVLYRYRAKPYTEPVLFVLCF